MSWQFMPSIYDPSCKEESSDIKKSRDVRIIYAGAPES